MNRLLNKTIIITIALTLIGGTAFGVDLDTLEEGFQGFSDDISQSLPQASTTGLTWSDASVRGFPHFGVGLSFGAVTIPSDTFTDLAEQLEVDLPDAINDASLGVPFPAYALDARVGIPLLPIDIGAKLGVLPTSVADSLGGDTAADYMLAGLEVRYPLLKGRLIIPAISVSAGYNYLSGGITTKVPGGADNLESLQPGDSTSPELDAILSEVTLEDPTLRFAWKTHSLDFKVQASQSFLIITPYLGGAYTYGWSNAGGGISADISYGSYSASDLEDALDAAEYESGIDDGTFSVLSTANGGAFRAFGGFSFNLTILKLDLNGQYNFNTQSLGGGVNVRIQI